MSSKMPRSYKSIECEVIAAPNDSHVSINNDSLEASVGS